MKRFAVARTFAVLFVVAATVVGAANALPPKKVAKLSLTLTASTVDPTTNLYTLTVTGTGYGDPPTIWPSGHLHFVCGNTPGGICNTDLGWKSTGTAQPPPLFETTVVCRSGDVSIQAFDDDNGVKSNKIKGPAC